KSGFGSEAGVRHNSCHTRRSLRAFVVGFSGHRARRRS
ncbi:hypothetical protein A2U01_0057924, partial [Trifolium medium]|nr:hypothetical protein [Trifolium medium]